MRVEPEELGEITRRVMKRGRRYGSIDLDGAAMDVDHGLDVAGFTLSKVKETGESNQMVLYGCSPSWSPADVEDVVQRLERAWVEEGAFEHEAHSITTGDEVVSLTFVTWWDSGDFYTGRIDAAL